MPPRLVPLTAVKRPTTSTRPFESTATPLTVLFAPAKPFWKVVSSVPSAKSRATRLRVWPPRLVNAPPTTTLPTLAVRKVFVLRSSAKELTTGEPPVSRKAGGTKPVSTLPSVLSRATRDAVVTPLKEVNAPPTTVRPPKPGSTATALIAPSAPVPALKTVSSGRVVVKVSRARKSWPDPPVPL